MTLSTGTKLGRYAIRSLIGERGMDAVCLERAAWIGLERDRIHWYRSVKELSHERDLYVASPDTQRSLGNSLVEETSADSLAVIVKRHSVLKK
jgi:hypothetical protein